MSKVAATVISVILVLAVIAGGFYYITHRDTTTISSDTIMAKLEDASECTTQKMIYHGIVSLTKGTIPFIDKSNFVMTYKATVRAGFDISRAKVKVTDSLIEVTIPMTTIQEITIDPDSLKFYDTTFTLFKPDGKEAAKEALQEAEKDVEEKAVDSGILEAADENAESLLTAMLTDSAGDREIVIKHAG